MSNDNFPLTNWMAKTPQLDNLSLFEMTLPGTHNAGSDWKANYPVLSYPRHWIACQHDTFYAQLSKGARALDIRLIWEPAAAGLGKFQVHHDRSRNSRTLGDLISDVSEFLTRFPDEFIIIDFHELAGDQFDFTYFNDMIIHFLGERMIPWSNRNLSLGELKMLSTQQRILVASAPDRALNRGLFIDSIRHKWIGKGIVSPNELQKYIVDVLEYPPGPWAPWSLSATCYSALGGPLDIHAELDKWFDPQTSDWAMKCNIINVDFFEESKIVSYCRTANLKKAANRQQ